MPCKLKVNKSKSIVTIEQQGMQDAYYNEVLVNDEVV